MNPSALRRLGLLAMALAVVAIGHPTAQAPARQAPATDANTPLHLLKADYPVPYGPITAETIIGVSLL